MRKLLVLILYFLTGLFFLTNVNYVNAAASNTRDNKCVTCAPLDGWTGFEASAIIGYPPLDLGGLGGSLRYVCPDGSIHNGAAPPCIEDNLSSHYCQYHSETGKFIGSDNVKDVYAIPPSDKINNACSGDTPECSTKQGCITSDEEDEEQRVCKANQNCRSQSDCKGTDPTCSSNWCVSPDDKLLSDLDGDRRDVFKCKFFTPGTTPDCPEGADCNDPFGEEEVKPTPNTPLSQPCTDADDKWGCLKINTALGEVDTQAPEFVRWVLSFVLGVSGAIVLIIIIITGYRLMTSQGDPEKVKNAREALTAAIVGLLFIIFSLVILQFITVNVLQLPGFGG